MLPCKNRIINYNARRGFISAAGSSLLLLNIIGHYRLKKLGVHKLAGVACFKSFVFKKLYKSFCKGFINKNKIFLLRFAFAQIYYRFMSSAQTSGAA